MCSNQKSIADSRFLWRKIHRWRGKYVEYSTRFDGNAIEWQVWQKIVSVSVSRKELRVLHYSFLGDGDMHCTWFECIDHLADWSMQTNGTSNEKNNNRKKNWYYIHVQKSWKWAQFTHTCNGIPGFTLVLFRVSFALHSLHLYHLYVTLTLVQVCAQIENEVKWFLFRTVNCVQSVFESRNSEFASIFLNVDCDFFCMSVQVDLRNNWKRNK